ncbi:MAG: hypothetical protein FWH26_09835 [Oscillospiraceae bacterium]|nr:hypothetical protein [Oscillospiraceae bacterium]
MTDTVILDAGLKCLAEKLGILNAERFIALVLREPFDYTKWREKHLFTDMSVKEISRAAKQFCDDNPDA